MANVSKLRDYALIGNCRTAALVSKRGSIDWCCFPEFHSPAIFSGLLDGKKGGFFSIAPVQEFHSFQKYIDDTVVVETTFETNDGEIKLNDAFVVMREDQKKLSLFADHEILRIAQCTFGTVQMKMEFEPTIFYGSKAANLFNNKNLGIKFTWKENSFILQSTLNAEQIQVNANKATAYFVLEKGESVIFSLSCSSQSPAIIPELSVTACDRFIRTLDYWKTWAGYSTYNGIYKKEVCRSALTLKLLAHAPSGAIIAAPTTSLPEAPGSERNWDYRYCWLRDASFTVRVLIKLGYEEEAHAYMNWILHATKLTQPELQVLYSVYGQAKLKEKKIDWLEGFRNSKPVRIGNGAHNQFQLDVYGEVLDAFYSYSKLIKDFDSESRRFIIGLGEIICKKWNEPDNGIWEVRSSAAHHTHSKVMAWVGLDRLIKLCKKYKWKKAPVEKFEEIRKGIQDQIESFGFNSQLNSYTQAFNESSLDASSLVFSLVDYCPANSKNMVSTVQCIFEKISKNGFIYRYHRKDDGIEGQEGAFGICNFWMVENLAKQGKTDDAILLFQNMLKCASDTGLFSEELDPESLELLGNYPQGFTHIGLINAAFSINEALKEKNGT
jgi:GH15 family glucan-1,4-alpha-glucosidase